jgi:hypothetical protein
MTRNPLYSSRQPLPERSGPGYGVIILAAAALLVVVLGTALGAGIDQNTQTPPTPDEGGADVLIPQTGVDDQESLNEQRQSMRCALGGNNCPPPEGDDD